MISFAQNIPNLPSQPDAKLGRSFQWNGIAFTVTSLTLAHYAGVEGELPFQYWDKNYVVFIDLRSHTNDFATLDYSDEKPVLYVGKAVDFDDLRLMNTRKFESW